jgi:prolyl-tRNA editing enzyme YbaK/EbsC (Cys-tRNA(Pro) deacylase)
MTLDLLEAHVSALERVIFPHPIIVPDPAFPESDHLDPALVALSSDPILSGLCAARRVPNDFYDYDLEYRRLCLGAQSLPQLCKCVLFEVKDAPISLNRFVCVVVQMIDRINHSKLLAGCSQISGARVSDVSVAREEDAVGLTGSIYNGMTPVLMKPDTAHAHLSVKVVMSRRIAALEERFFWLGGGEVGVKFGVATFAFIAKFKPLIFDIST